MVSNCSIDFRSIIADYVFVFPFFFFVSIHNLWSLVYFIPNDRHRQHNHFMFLFCLRQKSIGSIPVPFACIGGDGGGLSMTLIVFFFLFLMFSVSG